MVKMTSRSDSFSRLKPSLHPSSSVWWTSRASVGIRMAMFWTVAGDGDSWAGWAAAMIQATPSPLVESLLAARPHHDGRVGARRRLRRRPDPPGPVGKPNACHRRAAAPPSRQRRLRRGDRHPVPPRPQRVGWRAERDPPRAPARRRGHRAIPRCRGLAPRPRPARPEGSGAHAQPSGAGDVLLLRRHGAMW